MPSNQFRLPADHAIVVLDEVGSTNTEAMRLAAQGENGPLWVMARRQTSGRGRSGRQWISNEGNLHASLLLSSTCAPEQAHQLALLAGIAVYDAALKLAGRNDGGAEQSGSKGSETGLAGVALSKLALKWPNDGLINGEKFAGVLSECRPGASGGTAGEGSRGPAGISQIVVGIGINLASAPDNTGRPVTYLKRHGITADPETALVAVAQGFAHWLPIWRDGKGFSEIRRAWLRRCVPLDEPMGINTGAGLLWGRFAGLDNAGALLLQMDNGTIERFTFGDVSLAGEQRDY